jgi:hypothetical protein
MFVVLEKGYFRTVNVFQVLTVVAVIALAAAVNAYPGYAHHGFYPISAPSHGHEYHVSTSIFYGTHSFIITRNCCPVLVYVLDTCLVTKSNKLIRTSRDIGFSDFVHRPDFS